MDDDAFHDNPLYHLLSKDTVYSDELLQDLHVILHEQPELAELHHPIEGSYLHLVCRNSREQENVAYRMIHALSNAGANPNLTDEKGNTPLHEAVLRDVSEIKTDVIQALFRIGVDPRIANKEGKTPDGYLEDDPQLVALYEGYGDGIWAAIETSDAQETDRLIKGFIKFDCKSQSKESLLSKARDLNRPPIIRILADYQVTIEFVHSILACDWQRAALIDQYEGQFIKINTSDATHLLTWARTTHRTCSKSILEICLDTQAPKALEIVFASSALKSVVDVNILGTDGLPFFFHVFDACVPTDLQTVILSKANLTRKSSKGETFLFRLVRLYVQNTHPHYLTTFADILERQPILLAQRNEQGRTIVDEIELTSSLVYDQLRPFYETIKNLLQSQWKNPTLCERFVLNSFGYHLLLFVDDEQLQSDKLHQDLLLSLKLRQGLPALMYDLVRAIAENNLAKVQQICKAKSSIVFAKDWSGRTCVHLAVLHRRREILRSVCENNDQVVNFTDNLGRTPLHYACIMNDEPAVNILQKANAKKLSDCLNLYPSDYMIHRDLCSEEFHAQGFPNAELQRHLPGISDYLKLAYYLSLKESIEENRIDRIRAINGEMNAMGFHLKDFDPDSYVNDWLRGQRYTPLLFLALEKRFTGCIQCLMELGLPAMGRMYMVKSDITSNSRCVSFRTRAEELECFDIIGIIDDLEDDHELKSIFKRHLSAAVTPYQLADHLSARQPKRQRLPQQDLKSQQMKSQACILL